jgi:lipopolysaccharide/colanic/teichoic acid biosynthesis glycosyltransferase
MSAADSRIKRTLDVVLAALALVILSPLIAAVALIVRRDVGPPVLLRQQRAGLEGAPFTMLKFRTMTDARDRDGSLLPDGERLTPTGRRLRSASLDELPELVNVVRGEMSLVGPRPLLLQYLPLYSARQRRRHEVRPGVTGLAQIKGRNELGWPEKLELDVTYVETWSLGLDLRILGMTIIRTIARQGISPRGLDTPPLFRGDDAGG